MASLGPAKGTYIILFRLRKSQTVQIGKLGRFPFRAGYFAYTGSAYGPGGLAARIRHHLSTSPRPHWHLDYLTEGTVPLEIWVSTQDQKREHAWASALSHLAGAVVPAPGFGSSDCRCPTHLFYFRKRPPFQRFEMAIRASRPREGRIERFVV